MHNLVQAAILGVVEGVTEFLPISSTGHLIIVNQIVKFKGDFADMFDIVIQLGAIISVIVYFWGRLAPWGGNKSHEERAGAWSMWSKAVVAVLPALVIGAALEHKIKALFFNPRVVSIALLVGGILLIWIESRKRTAKIESVAKLAYSTAFAIGCIQCLSMIPGTSRSAATIIGAMLLGASRGTAVEFSFFLAIPTMIAASAYSLYKYATAVAGGKWWHHDTLAYLCSGTFMTAGQWLTLAVGFFVSFFVAWAVIAFLMNYIRKHDFKPFGYYRIVLGLAIMALIYLRLFPAL